ncbi:unnamed protein product [Linum tenue]|uniref:HORMA domain-containing protein n=1 Tax=Linum tenue TaxID=586396 RepID=A0AAV0H7G5_9ROSI|nr:unnamed protein product [Linum tenue]
MAVAHKVKEAEITEQDSLLLTRNLMRIAIFNISYIRGLFPEKYFTDKNVPALEMKIKKLMPMDAESRRLIDWMEKGVYDALQKKYLKMLLFCVCEAIDGPMIEEYSFSFSYSDSDSQEVSMNINRIGNKKKGGSFKCNSVTECTPNQMRSSACKMVRTLVQLMRTLDKMPEERTILMKLLYYDDITPPDYEPPFFRECSEEDAHNPWTKSPLRMEVGNVNSKHFVLALKVKSVLDPCDDGNEDMEENAVNLGADSDPGDDSSNGSDSEDNESEDRFIVAPAGKQKQTEVDSGIPDQDDTQDPEEDEQQLARVKDWVNSYHRDTIELTDILSHFTDITVALTEEIIDKLVNQGVLSKAGTDLYTIIKQKTSEFDFMTVKEEMKGQAAQVGDKSPQVDDYLYMKALYHALPMTYVTIPKLQNELKGEACNLTTLRKLMNKMTNDGYLEAKGSRRLGKRVIHSSVTEKKLTEVKKALLQLQDDPMDLDTNENQTKAAAPAEQPKSGTKQRDNNNSTCGGLHSVGSDLTRTKLGSVWTEQTVTKPREHGNTPTSKAAEPVASRESGNVEAVLCSRSSQDRKGRKSSTMESEKKAKSGGGGPELKHLGIVRLAAIKALVTVSSLYGYAKQNSGPLRSAVGTVEGAVSSVVSPVYQKFKGVPDDLLVFFDRKVDEASAKFDKHAPPVAKKVVGQAQSLFHSAAMKAEKLVNEARTKGPKAAFCYTVTETKHVVVSNSVKVYCILDRYPSVHSIAESTLPTAAQWSEKYNETVKGLNQKGYPLVGYFPLVPVDEIEKEFQREKGEVKKEHANGGTKHKKEGDSSSSSDSD